MAQLGGNPGLLTVGQLAEKSYTSQSLLKTSWPLAVGCLESPKAWPSPGPLRFSAVGRERDGAGGGNNVPLETCTNSPGRL